MTLPPTDPSDELLALRVRQRDRIAFTMIYDRYAPLVYSLAVHMLGSTDAEEIVQDIFLKLWNKADQFDLERGSFGGWFMTLARHRVLDKLRERSHQERTVAAEEIDLLLAEAVDPSVNVEEETWLRQRGEAIVHALKDLPDEQRRAIVLAYFGGLSQSAIAEHLGWPLGTVKKRIQLGLRKLRAALHGLKTDEQAHVEKRG
jgi:RNA polymerase sigma-70 factor, ECF subfamily